MSLTRVLCPLLLASLALGCSSSPSPHPSGPDAGPDGGGANGPDGGMQVGGLPSTANSVQVSTGPGRADPEGAPPAPSTQHLTWKDAQGADRSLTLYAYLYEYDFSFLGGTPDPTQVTQRSANDNAYGHPGFGYVVSHNTMNSNSPLGKFNAPSLVKTTVFSGGHHALHHVELVYDRDKEPMGGLGIQIPVVIEWFVATGRDHPVWAVNYKAGSISNPMATNLDMYRMDTRGPYGSLNWDGAATPNDGDAIGGVAWGDFGLRFRTTDAQLTLNSPWTYNAANRVDFVQAWTATTNAEMGIVETRLADKQMGYPDRVVGRERGSTSAGAFTNKGDCNGLNDARVYSVPCVNGWPYQMMNYDWDPGTGKAAGEATSTKLLGWGSPYGWLGASNADLFDFSGTVDGRGDRGYSTFIVLGPKCRYATAGGACDQPGVVAETLAAVDALASASLTAVAPAAVVAQVPVGPGATQMRPVANGYDDTFGVFALQAGPQGATFTFTPAAAQAVLRPIFRIGAYSDAHLPNIAVDGTSVSVNSGKADSGTFVSLDVDTHTLWVTLNKNVTQATTLTVTPPAAP